MRMYRAAAVTIAALALTIATACSSDSSSNGGPITCSDAPVCPSGSLAAGLTQPTGAPTIVPASISTDVSTSTSSFIAMGATTATTNGYWILVQNGVASAWGVLAVSSGAYAGEIPLRCGAQRLYYAFTNGSGTSYWYLNVTLSGCSGPAEFRVQLTWVSDPNSDLDLHLLRPAGVFGSANDCYFGDCTGLGLTWGTSNPRLDVDDTNGFGPENIYLSANAESGDYRIIIHDFDHTVGEVATVRIYFNDVEAAHYTSSPAMDGTTHLYWEVAKVNVLTHVITPVNVFTSTTPVSLGAPPAWVPIAK
jgi:uncharacterized protein YfaP (DUF2135 family)